MHFFELFALHKLNKVDKIFRRPSAGSLIQHAQKSIATKLLINQH